MQSNTDSVCSPPSPALTRVRDIYFSRKSVAGTFVERPVLYARRTRAAVREIDTERPTGRPLSRRTRQHENHSVDRSAYIHNNTTDNRGRRDRQLYAEMTRPRDERGRDNMVLFSFSFQLTRKQAPTVRSELRFTVSGDAYSVRGPRHARARGRSMKNRARPTYSLYAGCSFTAVKVSLPNTLGRAPIDACVYTSEKYK